MHRSTDDASLLTGEDTDSEKQPDTLSAAFFGLCPRCGEKTLFRSFVGFADKCRVCGLDFTQYNVGDGPAAFLTLIVGAIICAMALTLEVKVDPPFWVHIVLWVPLTVAAVFGSLRVSKAALLILEHKNQAREGELSVQEDDTPPLP